MGTVYFVPDGWWGFETPGGVDHPGVCVATDGKYRVTLLKGVTEKHRHVGAFNYHVILPDASNGLTKPTAFDLAPRPMKLSKVLLLGHERRSGTLCQTDLAELLNRLWNSFHALRQQQEEE